MRKNRGRYHISLSLSFLILFTLLNLFAENSFAENVAIEERKPSFIPIPANITVQEDVEEVITPEAVIEVDEVSVVATVPEETIKDLVSQAIMHYNGRQYETAKQVFEEVLALDPDNREATTYLERRIPKKLKAENERKVKMLYSDAVALYQDGLYKEALKNFNEVLEIDPEHKQANKYVDEIIPETLPEVEARNLIDEALFAYKNDDLDQAEELFQEALRDDPNNRKAKLYIKNKIPKRKEKIKNDKINELYSQGRSYFSDGDLDKAEAVFIELLDIDPDHNGAKKYLEKTIPDRREALKKKAIKKLYDKGYADFYRGNYRDAQVSFEEILALDSAQVEAREYVSKKIPAALKIDLLYKEALKAFLDEDYLLADTKFRQILQLDPGQKKARSYVLRKLPPLLKRLKPKAEVEETILDEEISPVVIAVDSAGQQEKLIAIKRQGPIDMMHDADMYYNKGDYTKALMLYNQVWGEAEDSVLKERARMAAELVNALIVAESKSGEDSVVDIEKAVNIKERIVNKQISTLYRRAIAAFNQGEYKEASNLFKQIYFTDPSQDRAKKYLEKKIPQRLETLTYKRINMLYREADRAYQRGDAETAEMMYREILFLNPRDEKALYFVKTKIPSIRANKKIEALHKEGVKYFDEKQYDKADVAFKEILYLDPTDSMARVYVENKIPQKLRGLRRREISELYEEALMYFRTEEFARSAQAFREVLDIDPFEERARFYLERKIPEGMKKLEKKQIKRLYTEALTRYKNKDYEGAKRIFQDILIIDPNQRKAQFYLGVKLPEAEKNALNRKIAVLYKDAIKYFKNKQFDDAQYVFEKIIDLDPEQEKARRYLEKEIPQAREEFFAQQQEAMAETMAVIIQESTQPIPEGEVIIVEERVVEERIVPTSRMDLISNTLESLEREKKPLEITIIDETVAVDEYIPISKEAVPADELDKLYEEAFSSYNNGDYLTAEGHFEKILIMDPDQRIAELYLENIKEALRQ